MKSNKKILFIISNLQTGGVSKSMTSLMNVIDTNRYDVSLMITSPIGALMPLLPQNIRVITNPIWQQLVSGSKGIWTLTKTGHPLLAMGHALRLLTSRFSKAYAGVILARLMPPIKEEFDTIVDFNGQHQLYYMVNKLNARKKVTFFHSDYSKWPYYYNADKKYFKSVDRIYTISQACVESLKSYFPSENHKIQLFENISSLKMIDKLANEKIADIEKSSPILLTIGHVSEAKGSSWAIEAADILKRQNWRFHWYFLGSCDDIERYSSLVKKYDLEKQITFLGTKVNPYPYIKRATLIVHPSTFEGKSIALDEAKLLCKPVVVTNFSTVGDQFTDRVNASICEMNPQSIAKAIEELLYDTNLRETYSHNLLAERHDNSQEIEKLYAIFDE